MRNFLKDAWLILSEVFLFLLGFCFVFPIIAMVGFVYSFVKHAFFKFDYSAKKHLKPIIRILTLLSDGGANALGGEMINDILETKEGEIKHGKWYQTISSVTGLRKIFNNRDSKLRRFLNKIDKDHCDKAPTEMEMFYYKNHCQKSMKEL